MPREAQRHAVSNGSTTTATSNPVESSSLDTPVESLSLDVVAVFMPKSIHWAVGIIPGFSKISTSTEAVVVDVCCSISSCDPGNPSGAGRASSVVAVVVLVDALVVDRVLVLVDTVLDDVLVDVVVDDFVLVMDAVVDVVQLEGGLLDCTQQVLLLCEGFCM